MPLGLGVIAGSAVTLYYNNPAKVHKRWHWNWDGRFESYSKLINSDPPIYPIGQRIITLIRQSQYQRQQDGINDHRELTEIGKKQAILTGQRLKELGAKFDKIYTSEFTRAQQTCQLIVNELENNSVDEIIYDANLNEGLPILLEPYFHYRTKENFMDNVRKQAPAIFNAFKTHFHRRDSKLMKETPDGREDILIVGHGNVFRYCLLRLLQFDTVGWGRFGMNNCGISRIYIYDDGHVKVTHLGDTGHLPPELLTNNLKELSI